MEISINMFMIKYFTKILEKNGFNILEVHKLNWIKGLKDLICGIHYS